MNQRMTESKSVALPLGDTPALKLRMTVVLEIFIYFKPNYGPLYANGVNSGIRTHDLQGHNLAR